MAPDVNWNVIENVAKTQDYTEGEIEQAIDQLKGVNGDEFAKEPDKILLLYKSAMKALDSRERAMEDFLQEQEDLIAENEELKKDIEEAKSFGRGPTKDVDFYRLESRKQTEEIQLLQRDVEDLRNELDRATQERYNHEKDLEDAKRTARHLKEENRSLVDSLREYRNIVENQQHKYKDNTSADSKDKIIEKNKHISELIDQITHLEEQNRELVEGNKKMRSEMESGQEDMEKMAEEYEKMRKVIGASDHFTDDLHRQNAQLKVQVDDLRDQLRSKEEEEDTIANAVDVKVQEWTKKLQQRDQENIEQGRIISSLRQKITAVSLDQDRINVERLTKRLEEKEKQNKELHDNLSQAVADLEEQTTLVEELRNNKGTNKETLTYRSQIRNLQSQVTDNEAITREAKTQQQRIESEAQETDIKLTEALKRIALLESGQYGLTEAVDEIKQCKSEIRDRDKDIQDLTREANKLEEKLNDLLEENEEYRERLGVDPRDMNDIINLRKSRGLRQQQYRAENQVLLKEIENLEEERIELKKQIRRQAQSQTQKAIGEGLHQDDIDQIDDYIEELKRKRKHGISEPAMSKQKITKAPSERWASPQNNTISQYQLDTAHADNTKLKQESKMILSENDDLRAAMKDILHELKQSNNSPRPVELLKLPSIERLLHAMESRQVAVEGNSHFKAQVDQLTGRNEEIRSEMRELRSENSKLSAQNEIYKQQVLKLTNDLEDMNKIDFVRNRASMVNLPTDPNSSTDDIVNALNEQLIQTLHDSSKKSTQLKEMKEALENSRRQLNVLRQQTHLLYKEHLEEKSKMEEKMKSEEERRRKLQEQHDRDVIKVDEYERLLVTLKSDPDEAKKRLAETSRKVSLLRVNEKTLIRRHKASEVTEELLTSENSRLKNEIVQIEKAVAQRVGYLERYKAMAAFKIDAMQKSLEGSVPESELSQVNRRFDELTSKYRDLLQKENQFVTRNIKVEELQEELKITNEEMVALREELSIEKERRHALEEAGRRAGFDPGRGLGSSEVTSIMKQISVLEMKELNERQKAEHASRMFNRLKSSLDDLQNRNSELENKFSQLTKLNLEAQRTERDLRDELAEVVPRSVSDADRKKIAGLKEDLIKTKTKMSQLQDMSDISHNQLQSVQAQQQSRDREMKSLHQQLKEFQFQTDQNALIGKLHHQILNLQASELDSERNIEKAKKNVIKLQAHIVKLEKQLDEKEDVVYLTRTESNNKNRQLKKTIQGLRQQFSGAVPLAQQEKFARSMTRLQEDKLLIQEELRRTRKEREKIEDKLAEAEVQKQGLDELRKAIEDERGADKLTEWCHRMDVLRLQDMKLQRQVVRQNEQIKHVEILNGQYEKTISSLEEDIVQILKVQEEHQMEWELREMELEKLLDQFQSKQREVTKKARRLEDITQTLPDPSLPLDQQLTSALKTIKDHIKTNRDLQGQIKALEFENDRLKDVRHNLESNVTTRDRIINELRLHMPVTSAATGIKSDVTIESKQQLRVAMDTIETLKKRLSAKEESIERYKQLLEEARKENEQATHSHERELMLMQQRIHGKTDDAFNRFKKAAHGAVSPRSSAPSANDVRNISELEEMVREQDAAMSALMDRVRAANTDVAKQKKIVSELRRKHEAEKQKMQEEHEHLVSVIKTKLAKKHRRIDDMEKELSYLKSELDKQKDANSRAPATTMKNLVSRLKTQLSEKEKQQQQLSHALAELRSDLVLQAQENVRAAQAEENDAVAVKGLVGKRTAQYKLQIEELKDRVAEQQRGLKQAKRSEETLKAELKKILEETEKKEQILQKQKVDKRSLDHEIMQLKDKIKRLCRTRGPDSGLKFPEETPVKLVAEPVVKPVKKQPVEGINIARDSDDGTSSSISHSDAPKVQRTSRPTTFADEERMSRLKADLSRLRGENDNLKEKLKQKTEEPTQSTVEVAKWDIKKQWQSKVENLKRKLVEKDKLIQASEKQIESHKDQISRLEREKLRRAAAPIGPPIHANPTLEDAIEPVDQVVRKHLHKIEELSSQLHQLGEENNKLRKLAELPRDKIAAEMEVKNSNLNHKLDALQKEILTAGLRQERDETIAEQYRQSENQMQGRMLKLASDATELQFNYDQVKRDIPRLQDRIEHQQQYINLLKSEKKEAEQRAERSKKQTHKKSSVGQSGKTVPELERTVVLMKKVVERVQRENDQLKQAPGVVTNQTLEELKSEKQLLKNRINEMTQQIGGQLSMRYESKTQSVDKLMKENEKLRRELDKRGSARDKIRDSRASVQVERDQLFKELEETKKKLVVAQSKAPKVAGAGSRGYNSAVTSKMLEARLKKSEETVEKQSSEMRALKSFLEEKEEAENNLEVEVERLKEQVEILERFPPGAGSSDPNTIRELQITRLTVARLEHEKKELEFSVSKLEKQNSHRPSTSTDAPDNLSTKADHLKLATENHVTHQENERLKLELGHAKKELSHFDDTFFDEIEDLKYNYAEAVKKNVLYEGQLHHYSNLFGFEIDMPANDE